MSSATRAAVTAYASSLTTIHPSDVVRQSGLQFADVQLLAKEFLALREEKKSDGQDESEAAIIDRELRVIALEQAVKACDGADGVIETFYLLLIMLRGGHDKEVLGAPLSKELIVRLMGE